MVDIPTPPQPPPPVEIPTPPQPEAPPSRAGTEIDLREPAGFTLSSDGRSVEIFAAEVCNQRDAGSRSGDIFLSLRYTMGSEPESPGSTVASAGLASIADRQCARSVAQSTPFTLPSPGLYSVNLVLTEFSGFGASGSVVRDVVNLGVRSVSAPSTPQPIPPLPETILENGKSLAISGATRSTRLFSIAVPAGQQSLVVNLTAGSGDPDLRVTPPAGAVCDRTAVGSDTCTFSNPQAGTYRIAVQGFSAYEASLRASFSAPASAPVTQPPPPQQPPVSGDSGGGGSGGGAFGSFAAVLLGLAGALRRLLSMRSSISRRPS